MSCKIIPNGIDDGTSDLPRWRRSVFYLPTPNALSTRATVLQNIAFARDCWKSRVDIGKLVTHLGIEAFLDLPVRKCSQGMAQLAAIACAMATGARILLLDEPMSALDPTNVTVVTRAMRSYVRGGRSIVMSTHNLANVDQSCDRITFIVHGKIECHDHPRNHPGSCAIRYRELYEADRI